jgi:hypothetical protein
VEPFCVHYRGTAPDQVERSSRGVSEPLLPVAHGYRIDIFYRMLNDRELARGMSLDE